MSRERVRPDYRNQLLEIFQAALARVEGSAVVAAWLRQNPLPGPVALVAVGKAAQAMARGARQVLGAQIRRALIISKPGHIDLIYCAGLGWEALEAGHPVPDAASLRAGGRLLEFLSEGGEPLLYLISGGASSLVEVPVPGVDGSFLARANTWLLGSGLNILEVNRVRKGLSRIKGGGLLAHLGRRRVEALAISDVPGDRPEAIGSGLLTPDPELEAGLALLDLPGWLRERLHPGNDRTPCAAPPPMRLLANLEMALQAAAGKAVGLGYEVELHRALLQGDAAAAGRRLAGTLRAGPCGVSLWGGETGVRLPEEPGRGGRNQHLALAAAEILAGAENCYLLAAGSDGSDGPGEDAGALVDGGTLSRGGLEGCDARASLDTADAGSFLEASGDLVATGPTGTNVMDLVIGLKVADV